MTIEFTVSAVIPAAPQEIYDAWLSSEGHTAMTGGEANVSAEPGAEFNAWDGYISGRNVELNSGKRIVQTWRTAEFAEADGDSTIEVTLEPVEGGTLLTLRHSQAPDGGEHYEQGWAKSYFEPMKDFFGAG